MPECCTTGRTARFWKLAHHYVRSDTSKLWRSNAEPLILKIYPCDFDIGMLDLSCTLHALELAWTLKKNETCKNFIQSTIVSFISSPEPSSIETITFTFACLRIMAQEGGFDTSLIGTNKFFEFCAGCYSASEALKSMAVAAWRTCCTAVNLDTLMSIADGLELLMQTPVEKVASWCKVDENLINASFRVGSSDILTESIRQIPQSVKLEVETVQSTWFMLVALSCNRHLINEDHLDIASSIVALYFDKASSLTSSLEHLKLELEGKTLEKLFLASLDVLRQSNGCVPIDVSSDSWHWIQYRPKVFKTFTSYLVAYPSTDIEKLSKAFGRHKMWWDVLANHSPNPEKHVEVALEFAPPSLDFLWKILCDEIIGKIPFEMVVEYLIDNDVALSDHSEVRRLLQSDDALSLLDDPCERLLKYLAKNQISLSDRAKEKLWNFCRQALKR